MVEHLISNQDVVGSRPTSRSTQVNNAGLAQLVEHLFCKQAVIGSSPMFGTIYGGIAQLVERLPCKQIVSGSIPLASTIMQLQWAFSSGVRAAGLYPAGRWFKSNRAYQILQYLRL